MVLYRFFADNGCARFLLRLLLLLQLLTLLTLASLRRGPTQKPFMANNHPFRGHKHDPWEGGTRVATFLSGGFLPQNLRGKVTGDKVVHIADWCVRPSRGMISQLRLVFVAEVLGIGAGIRRSACWLGSTRATMLTLVTARCTPSTES